MIYVYVLKSFERNYIYVGITENLIRRLKEHNNGYNKTTKPYAPFELIHQEEFSNRKEARTKEKYYKSGSGKEWIKNNFL
jgi:putative endonuclease